MYLKWIVCEVENEFKSAFSEAQEKWFETKKTKGFMGQIGGWNLQYPTEACILSFWEDKNSLNYFMENIHYEIFNNNKQEKTYKSIYVNYFNLKFNMPGSEIDFARRIKTATFLRIADCKVKPEKVNHFEEVQKSIWLPGMRKTKGMLGGEFSISEKEMSRYLVSTFWDSEKNHAQYVKNNLSILQNKSDVENDLLNITGKQILLENSWRVI
ncbi:MAG: YdbC family protein [Melioribacteraceae bacterium]